MVKIESENKLFSLYSLITNYVNDNFVKYNKVTAPNIKWPFKNNQ